MEGEQDPEADQPAEPWPVVPPLPVAEAVPASVEYSLPDADEQVRPVPGLIWRLAVMMFLSSLPLALWSVTLGSYIGLNTEAAGTGMFSPGFVGIAYSTAALGAVLAPLLVGAMADQLVSANRLLFVLYLASAVLLAVLAQVESQVVFFWVLLLHFQCFMPTMSLIAAVAFHHLPDPERQFPRVRVVATFSWVVGGLIVGLFCPWVLGYSVEATTVPMKLAAVALVVIGLYCLTLPHTPPMNRGRKLTFGALLGYDAIRLLAQPAFAVVLLGTMLVAIPVQFYLNFGNVYLNQLGVEAAAAKQTLGQVAEIFCLLALPWVLWRWGVKATLLVGIGAWSVRYLLLAYADNADRAWMYYGAIVLHGFCFTFVYLAAQVFVNRVAGPTARAAAQGLFTLCTMGVGHLLGALLSGYAQSRLLTPPGVDPPPYDWQTFWLWPCAGALVPLVLVAVFLRGDR